MLKHTFVVLLSCLLLIGETQNIVVGAQQTSLYMPHLKGKSIAIVANQTSVIDDTHLVDSLFSLKTEIKKIFAPEHGFRGKADAGEHVQNGIDLKTGLPIVSLYGKNKKPNKQQLKDIDLIIFDIQDVGVRFYTYISTLHYIMQSCAENGIELIVLDRPNPNGHYIDGPTRDSGFVSFVSMHPVPLVHGLTIGEYAQMINGEGWLKTKQACNLKVVKCLNYSHKTSYSLSIAPSPNLKSDQSIALYPSLGLFEGTIVSVGRGTETPFELIGHPSCNVNDFTFTPKSSPGAKYPKHENQVCKGYKLTDFAEQQLTKKPAVYLHWILELYKDYGKEDFFSNPRFFDLLAGSDQLRNQILDNYSVLQIKNSWKQDLKAFQEKRKLYLLYEDF